MNQDNGGVIGKINTPTTSLASGVWSLDSQFDSQSSSIWPLAFPQTTIANSCRFDEGSSDTLTRTPSGAGNRRTWTYSAWHKVEAYTNAKAGRFLVAQTDGSNLVDFAYGSNGEIYLGIYEGGAWKETTTNAKHRDVSAW